MKSDNRRLGRPRERGSLMNCTESLHCRFRIVGPAASSLRISSQRTALATVISSPERRGETLCRVPFLLPFACVPALVAPRVSVTPLPILALLALVEVRPLAVWLAALVPIFLVGTAFAGIP